MKRLDEFGRMTLPHLTAAHTLAYWLVRNRSDAEDIVQEAFLRAYRGYDGFQGGDVRVWLLTIVRNTAYRWLSDRHRRSNVIAFDEAFNRYGDKESSEDEVASSEPSPEDDLINSDNRHAILQALGRLPAQLREAIVLREIEGLSYREIADVAGVKIGTVMSRLARSRSLLRASLAHLNNKTEAKGGL
ncbi:MAG: sigma-70 family RNA polymerase sigma factor [Hyphomicrobium sp.]|jgi:RNA polymerase sigma-70 factor (ECF subfamily)